MLYQISNGAVAFGDDVILHSIDFEIRNTEKIAIVGRNGCGKTTLLKLISGEVEMEKLDSDESAFIAKAGNPEIGYLKQIAFDDPDVTLEQEVRKCFVKMDERKAELARAAAELEHDYSDEKVARYTAMEEAFKDDGGYYYEKEYEVMIRKFGFSDDERKKPIRDFSGGQQTKIAFIKLLLSKPDILLLDEPTNGLDIQSITWLEDFLIDFENTVIVVSHDRHFLNKVCTHMADLDFGKIKLYVGNYDFWKESSELAAKLQADRNAKAEEKIKQLQEFVARFSANASKSKQATSRKKMLDKIELEEIVPSSRKYPFINFKAEREIGNDLLTVENLSVKIDGETILDNISFILRPGDKTALIGQNDIQTTALIRALMDDIEYEGTVKWGVTTSRSYLPKDNSRDFAGGESILDWLRQFASKEEDDNTFLRGFLGRMLFSGDEVNKSVNVLSGGEKVRVMLSKLMLLKSNVLVLDDPTNHLDLESISSLNDGLKNFKESIIFASHDHEFIQTLANHIIVLSKNGVIDRIDETYDEFLENEEVQAKVKELWSQS